MGKIGRNEICHCGSGKKYKHCHQQIDDKKESTNKSMIIVGVIVLLIIISAFGLYMNSQSTSGPSTTSGTSAPGPAPEGKVWSPEHGHWHDK